MIFPNIKNYSPKTEIGGGLAPKNIKVKPASKTETGGGLAPASIKVKPAPKTETGGGLAPARP